MAPGQVIPNELESAILRHIASKEPFLLDRIPDLQVLSREFTGVGSRTRFQCRETSDSKHRLSLNALITMPGVPNGMGAMLLCTGSEPEELEVFTYGDSLWAGNYEGFSLEETA
jgi:hypothetical protein